MGTFGKGGKRIANRERNKAIKKGAKISAALRNEINSLSGRDAIQAEINRLKSVIMNCNYDLNTGLLMGNPNIKNKLKNAEEQLKIKLNELDNLR